MMSDFFQMGGYAFYVWTSYALALVVIILNGLLPYFEHKRNLHKAAEFYQFNEDLNDDSKTK